MSSRRSSVCLRPRWSRSASSVARVVAGHAAARDGLVERLLQALAGDDHDLARVEEALELLARGVVRALARRRGRLARGGRLRSRRPAGRLALGHGRRLPRDEELKQRLEHVAPVLGLVPDPLAIAVEDALGDLLARVGGQAVQRERVRRGAVEQRVVEPVGSERLAARGGLARRRRSSRPRRRCRRRRRRPRPRPDRSVSCAPEPVLELEALGRGDAPPRRRPARRRSPASGRRCCRRRRRRAGGPRSRRTPRAASSGRRAPGTGGGRGESMFTTGTVACSASSSSRSSLDGPQADRARRGGRTPAPCRAPTPRA